ncbi:MAG TPA: hypothetical protein VFP04_02180 [Nitrospira sp.]|nr:hypothetical protein [Nitrospira sp.]
MSLNRWIRKLDRKLNGLTIELLAHDRFSLGSRMCNLKEHELTALKWSDAQRRRLYAGVMARNPRGYDAWHPDGNELVPVRLRSAEWRMVERLCTDLSVDARDGWHIRVVERIRSHLTLPTEPEDPRPRSS